MKNTGFNIQKEKADSSPKQWELNLGGNDEFIPSNLPIEECDLPTGEVQRRQDDDKMCCTTHGLHTAIQIIMNNQIRNGLLSVNAVEWLKRKGYLDDDGKVNLNDAFNAKLSNTTRNGNSLIKTIETFRRTGAVPEMLRPYDRNMSWDTFYDPTWITEEVKELAQEFSRIFNFNHYKIYAKDYAEFLKKTPMDTAGYAWPVPVHGVYQKSSNRINHCFAVYDPTYFAFDSYHDSVDGDFIKELSPDYNLLGYSYVFTITENKDYKWRNYPVDDLYGKFDRPNLKWRRMYLQFKYATKKLTTRELNGLLGYWKLSEIRDPNNTDWLFSHRVDKD